MSGVAHHYGPSVEHVGGMASVLAVISASSVGADTVALHPTWVPTSQAENVRLWMHAARTIVRTSRRDIVHVHLSERGSFVREGSLLAIARRRGCLAAATIHGADFDEFVERHRRLAAGVLQQADLITVLSDTARATVERLAPSAVVSLMPNPVPVASDPGPPSSQRSRVVFAGELGKRKGLDVLARAWVLVRDAVPGAELVVAGPPGDVAPPMLDGLEHVGPIPSATVRDLMLGSRVVVLPSRAEAMPMTLLEAAACRRPFVATPVGGVAAIASAGGMLVPVEDHAALAESLVQLLTDDELADRLGAAGYQQADEQRSPAAVDAALRVLYVEARAAKSN